MRVAGLLTGRTLAMLGDELKPGMTTLDLDRLAEAFIRDHGGIPNFQLVDGYDHTLCTSVNEQIVHGIPSASVLLREGDLLSIDCGAEVDGWNGDSAVTLFVGGREAARTQDVQLSDATEASLWAGIAAMRVGGRLNDIGGAIEDSIVETGRREGHEYGIVQDYVGHGIGESMHLDPQVFNYRIRQRGPVLPVGATLAIEPMVTWGNQANHVLADDWTVVTDDRERASHWEHSVATTEHGVTVLTALDGGVERLSALGVPVVSLD